MALNLNRCIIACLAHAEFGIDLPGAMLQAGQEEEGGGLPSEISSSQAGWRPDDLERARELQQRPGGRKRSQKCKHVQIHQLQQQVHFTWQAYKRLLSAALHY